MADTKLSALPELAAAPAADDEIYIRDISELAAAESKRITVSNLATGSLDDTAGGTDALVTKAPTSNALFTFAELLTTFLSGEVFRTGVVSQTITTATAFSALINSGGTGGLTATNVPYDGDTNEGILNIESATSGRILIHNTTRNTYRKVSYGNIANNYFTTDNGCWYSTGANKDQAVADNWADNDVLTSQSQTNATAGYYDVTILTTSVPSTAKAILLTAQYQDIAATAFDVNRALLIHPYLGYDSGKRFQFLPLLAGDIATGEIIMPLYSNKFTVLHRATTTSTTYGIFTIKGYIS